MFIGILDFLIKKIFRAYSGPPRSYSTAACTPTVTELLALCSLVAPDHILGDECREESYRYDWYS